jgi:AcrR family transcriptional regulator
MTKKTLAPQQARSRDSLQRLIKAAWHVLNEKGLQGATIPRIAARAGLSTGSVYRRFPDKDALLREVVLETLRSADEQNRALLKPELAERMSLIELAEMAVRASLASHRANVGLLRAITQFTLSHPSNAFKKKVAELEIRAFDRVVNFLLLKRPDINHPKPEEAVAFGMLLVGLALREIVVFDILPDLRDPRLPANDDDLARELTRSFLNYLGIEHELGRATK